MLLRPLAIIPLLFVCTPTVSAMDDFPSDAKAFLNTYCVKCHQGEKAKAKIDLTQFQTAVSLKSEPMTWGNIIARVRDGEMPPVGNPAPTPKEREQFVEQTRKPLIAAIRECGPKPGPAPLHRPDAAAGG